MGCGVLISGCAIGSAVVLAGIVARVVGDSSAGEMRSWPAPLSILLALWAIRAVTHWLQARLGQRGASAVIADLSGQVLAAVTARPPAELAVQRDEAAVVVTRGLDGLRPYFTGYLPTLMLAAILTPATVAVIAAYDVKSTVIVAITLPLIPIFMVLIGLATRDRSAAALGAMTTLQARLLDLIAGIPTLRALGRSSGPDRRIAELAAAHRRSAMATLRIAFLSALVLELLATLGVALIAVGIGLRLVFGEMTLTAGLTVLLLAPDVYWPLRRIGVEFHAAQDGRTAAGAAFALIGEPGGPSAANVRTRTVTARGAPVRLEHLSVAGRDGQAPCDLSAVIEPGAPRAVTVRVRTFAA
ncbi:ABC transporter transmembrane domain-containing protein, partial [Mycobacterium avium]|uniref:ABC transporter transmembrane domain-containing protein n=1 Tax=Mycobacterium avium TaxID=1764 RepID=UPI0022AA2390